MTDPWIESADQLGEGPVWDHRSQCLWWVDILRARLHRCDLERAEHRTWELPRRASVIALTADPQRPLLATEGGVERFDARTGAPTLLCPMPADEPPQNRSNDGGVDTRGRFWFGTMSEEDGESTGSIYVYEHGALRRVLSDWGIPNTLRFSADGRRFYVADSAFRQIFVYAIDEHGALGSRETFIRTSPEVAPDGSVLDAEGYLWNCEWDGARVVRYAPDGTVDRVVELPASRTTACCFGGPQLDELFVTSAAVGLEREPAAGHVYRVPVGVRGLPATISEVGP